jgi:hypothetical protein
VQLTEGVRDDLAETIADGIECRRYHHRSSADSAFAAAYRTVMAERIEAKFA